MKKKISRRRRHRSTRLHKAPSEHYLVVVRGWMFLVAFALMLGLGAVVGNYVNQELARSAPQVAGAYTER